MSRLEDARRLANTNPRDTFVSPNLWQAHMRELLETIEHLQRENERLKVVLKGEREGMPALIERIEQLERANERLGREVWEQSQYITDLEDEVQEKA